MARKQKRVPFTKEESAAIEMGVARFGLGNWIKIKNAYPDVLSNRSNNQIKDRWRTLQKGKSKCAQTIFNNVENEKNELRILFESLNVEKNISQSSENRVLQKLIQMLRSCLELGDSPHHKEMYAEMARAMIRCHIKVSHAQETRLSDEDDDSVEDEGYMRDMNTIIAPAICVSNPPMIKNAKMVDPKDDSLQKIVQSEMAMGAVIECFEGASAVVVPCTQFAAVKKYNHLLLLRSDTYDITDNFTLTTTNFVGQKPGTSDLCKEVKEFINKHYFNNFFQATFHVLAYFNNEAIQTIVKMGVANGVKRFWIGKDGLLSTPSVNAVIRKKSPGWQKPFGAFILTASHNPDGPEEGVSIKYHCENGGPTPKKLTNEIYQNTTTIAFYKFYSSLPTIDIAMLENTSIVSTDGSEEVNVGREG